MKLKPTITAIANQKGGVGKTMTTVNLGIGLAQEGKRVLLIDLDPQDSMTISLGCSKPDEMPLNLSDLMGRVLTDQPIETASSLIRHGEGIDYIPASIELAAIDASLITAMSRETVLKQVLSEVKRNYDHILIDCSPSLGLLTINALAAADNVLIPVQSHYLPVKGLEQLLSTINKVQQKINPKLRIEGILLTMTDARTIFSKEISALLRDSYGSKLRIFKTEIPHSVRAAETSAVGKSIYAHDPNGKVADAYRALTREVLRHERVKKRQADLGR